MCACVRVPVDVYVCDGFCKSFVCVYVNEPSFVCVCVCVCVCVYLLKSLEPTCYRRYMTLQWPISGFNSIPTVNVNKNFLP